MAITIKYLDAPLGAEVSGLDLSKPMPRPKIDAIEAAWRERLVVVFHGQNLSDSELIAFSKNFGELDPPGPNPYGAPFNKQHPELNVISNVIEDGKPIGNLGDGEAVWHADMTYVDVPPKAVMLHALEVPPPEAGGNTYFANMFAAYDTLPAELKEAATARSPSTTPHATAPACCARATRTSPTCAKPSAPGIPWCGPTRAAAARRCS